MAMIVKKKIGESVTWVKGKKPTQLFEVADEKTIPYLSAVYFRTRKPDYYASAIDKNCVVVNEDDIVLIWDGSNAGDVFRGLKGALSSTMVKFNKSEECNDEYLYFLLKDNFNNLNKGTTGSTIPHVSGSVLREIEIAVVNVLEQKGIARTLTIIQNAITEQERVIVKLKELKRSTMQHLFTHGTKGEKAKMTEIGEIPESWDVVELGDYLEKTKTKDPSKDPDKEFIYIDVSAVSREYFKIISNQKMLGRNAPSRARKHIQTGDIIFATVRPTLQRIAIVPEEFNDQVCSTGYCVLRMKAELDTNFIFHYLCGDIVLKYVEGLQSGASYPAIRDSVLFKMMIPFPNLTEQKIIGRSLAAIDQKIESSQEKLSVYQDLFKTLLHELMSGERRVRI